jgi:hypothetical protein
MDKSKWSWSVKLSSAEFRRSRLVERLAHKMYEASEPASMPWLRQGWDVRQAWLRMAQERLGNSRNSLERLYAWSRAWRKPKGPRI